MSKVLWRASVAVLAPLAIGVIGATVPASAACVPATGLCVETTSDPVPSPVHVIGARAVATVEQTAPGGGSGDVCQPTLGGVIVPPLPAPTPGIRPAQTCRAALRAVDNNVGAIAEQGVGTISGLGGGDVCQPTLGGVIVPPLPAPTPGIRPQALVDQANAACQGAIGGGPVSHTGGGGL